MSFLRDTVQSAGAGIALTGARFAALAIMARQLEVELFGTLAFAIFCLDLVVLTCLIGLPGVVTRFLPVAGPEDLPAFNRLRRRWLAVSMTALAAAAPLAGWMVIGLEGAALALFTGWAALTAVQNAAVAEMQGAMRYDRMIVSGVSGALVLLVGAFAAVGERDLLAAMAVLAAGSAVQILPIIRMTRNAPDRHKPSLFPEPQTIRAYGANAWVTGLTTAIVWGRGELLVVEAALDARALGLYGAAMTLTALVWRLTGLLQGAIGPHLARRMDDAAVLTSFVHDVNRLTLSISAAVALAIALVGPEIAIVVFGPGFADAGRIMAVLAPGAATAGLGTVNLTVQFLSNAVVTRNALIAGSVFLPGVVWVLIGPFGTDGAAAGRSLTLVLLGAAMPAWMLLRGRAALGAEIFRALMLIVLAVTCAAALALMVELGLAVRLGLWLIGAYGLAIWATGSAAPGRMIRNALSTLRAH